MGTHECWDPITNDWQINYLNAGTGNDWAGQKIATELFFRVRNEFNSLPAANLGLTLPTGSEHENHFQIESMKNKTLSIEIKFNCHFMLG